MCPECKKRGINIHTKEPRKRCDKRVEFQLDYDSDTCQKMFDTVCGAFPPKPKDAKPRLELRVIDKGVLITITAKVEDVVFEAHERIH